MLIGQLAVALTQSVLDAVAPQARKLDEQRTAELSDRRDSSLYLALFIFTNEVRREISDLPNEIFPVPVPTFEGYLEAFPSPAASVCAS